MVTIQDKKINCTKKIIKINNEKYIYIPLENKKEEQFKLITKIGDYIYKGDIVAINKDDNFPIHSPISGYIKEITTKTISTSKTINCLKIQNDYKEEYQNKKENNTILSKVDFIHQLKESGIIGLSGSAYPTYKKYQNNAEYLIVNGMECEPLNSADNAIMYQYTEEILETIDKILEINNISKCYIAINENNTKIINNFLKYINTYPNVKIFPIKNYYPNGWERNIISEIFHKKYDKYPSELNIIVNNISTIYAIYEMLKYQKPLIDRIITISGNGIKKPSNICVKIGTPLNEIIPNTCIYKKNIKNLLFIAGGPINGVSLTTDDIIVTKDLTNITITKNKPQTCTPCLKCGKCIKYCPAKLKPIIILNNINNKDNIKKLFPEKCIDCGLCSYICPSRLNLREAVQKAKGEI